MISLGAKKETYTGSRCMVGGILLGRLAYGLDAVGRALEESKKPWLLGPAYSVRSAAEPAYKAGEKLQKMIPKAKPIVEKLLLTLKDYRPYAEFSYGDKDHVTQTLAAAREDLSAVAQEVVHICSKRRPQPGEGEALLRLKRVKRPKQAPLDRKIETSEPALPEWIEAQLKESQAQPEQGQTLGMTTVGEGIPWAIIAGVVGVIGATFLVGRV